MLEKFRKAKQPEIDRLIQLDRIGGIPSNRLEPRPSFAQALAGKRGAVIAEYKRASPSKGEINMNLSPEDVAAAYAASGAAAISVLTEEVYFKGSLDYLEPMSRFETPLLRKDFILHPLQVLETASTAASALLLIVRMLPGDELRDLLELTNAQGLDAVVEAFDEADLDRAQEAGAAIIQINNRDLDKLTTDLGVSERLIRKKRPGETWISASGIFKRHEIERMAGLGFEAVLIGTSLMAHGDPGAALAELTGKSA